MTMVPMHRSLFQYGSQCFIILGWSGIRQFVDSQSRILSISQAFMHPSTQHGHAWPCMAIIKMVIEHPHLPCSTSGLCQNCIVAGSWWAFQTMASGCGFSACCCSSGTGRRKNDLDRRQQHITFISSSPCLSYSLPLKKPTPTEAPRNLTPLILVQLALLERFLSGFVHPKVWMGPCFHWAYLVPKMGRDYLICTGLKLLDPGLRMTSHLWGQPRSINPNSQKPNFIIPSISPIILPIIMSSPKYDPNIKE